MVRRIVLILSLLLLAASTAPAQIPLEAGSNGNLITVFVQNPHPRLPLQGVAVLGALPPELEAPAALAAFLVPWVAWPGDISSASFVLDVDPFAPLGPLPPVDLKLGRADGDTLVFPLILEVVPADPLGADVRVEFRVDANAAGLDPGASLVARLDGAVAVPLADDGVSPDAAPGDGIHSGAWTAASGANRWHRWEVEVDGVPECDEGVTPEQRLFRVEDLLFDDLANPQVLPLATLNLCTVVTTPAAGGTSLFANRPNPFVGATTFAWVQKREATAELRLYDARGRQVAVPLPAQRFGPGEHRLRWDARDLRGHRIAAGVYRLELRLDGVRRDVRSVLVVR